MLEGLIVDLVPQHAGFAARDQAWRNSEARFWTSGGDRMLFSRADSERIRAEYRDIPPGPQRSIFFGIQTKDRFPLGFMGLIRVSHTSRTGMLAARIGEPEYWGGGYGTDALLLLVDYAFDWLDLRRLHLDTMSTNVRVHRQMEKVGFTLEGRQRQAAYADGEWFDWLGYGLLRDEWPGRIAMVEKLGLRERAAQIYGDQG